MCTSLSLFISHPSVIAISQHRPICFLTNCFSVSTRNHTLFLVPATLIESNLYELLQTQLQSEGNFSSRWDKSSTWLHIVFFRRPPICPDLLDFLSKFLKEFCFRLSSVLRESGKITYFLPGEVGDT